MLLQHQCVSHFIWAREYQTHPISAVKGKCTTLLNWLTRKHCILEGADAKALLKHAQSRHNNAANFSWRQILDLYTSVLATERLSSFLSWISRSIHWKCDGQTFGKWEIDIITRVGVLFSCFCLLYSSFRNRGEAHNRLYHSQTMSLLWSQLMLRPSRLHPSCRVATCAVGTVAAQPAVKK